MKPVSVSVDVPNSREDVYEFLDVLANHESFTDHLMDRWEFSGPRAGVDANAKARVRAPGSNEIISIEVVEAEPPYRIVEESVGARGRRRTRALIRSRSSPTAGRGSPSSSRGSRRHASSESPRP